MMELVAHEEVVFVAPNAEQPALLGRAAEAETTDQSEGLIALSLEHGRDRQEQLIDAIVAHELSKEPGTTFGKDGAIAVGMQGIEDVIDVDRVAVRNCSNLAGLGQHLAEPFG